MTSVPQSAELRKVFARADALAREAEQGLSTGHALIALFAVRNVAVEFLKSRCIDRHFPLMITHDDPGGAMQIARARVVPKPGPKLKHVVQTRAGERRYRREPSEESFEVGNDGRNLSLLQHDL